MIRLNKPVKLMEWGEGTNTVNQVWTEIGQGNIRTAKQRDGLTSLEIELKGQLEKKNKSDNTIKVVQQGEGMAARSDHWGEVAMGKLRSFETAAGKTLVNVDIPTAAKISNSREV